MARKKKFDFVFAKFYYFLQVPVKLQLTVVASFIIDHRCWFLCRSNTWTNTPKPQQGWGSGSGNGSEGWGNSGDINRPGTNSHWGEPQKGASSVGWDSDSDRSGSGCWSEPGRNTSSSNTWGGSGGTNTPDQSAPNPGSNWGDPAHKPNPSQSNSQSWGEPVKNSHGTKNWGEPNPKPSNEWGKGPESSTSRGTQGPNKPSGSPSDLKSFSLHFWQQLLLFACIITAVFCLVLSSFLSERTTHFLFNSLNIILDLGRLAGRPHAHCWAEGDRLHRMGGTLSRIHTPEDGD